MLHILFHYFKHHGTQRHLAMFPTGIQASRILTSQFCINHSDLRAKTEQRLMGKINSITQTS